jgi:hypothetical protein
VRLEREKREEEGAKRLVDGDWSPLAFPGRFCRRSRDEPRTTLDFEQQRKLSTWFDLYEWHRPFFSSFLHSHMSTTFRTSVVVEGAHPVALEFTHTHRGLAPGSREPQSAT